MNEEELKEACQIFKKDILENDDPMIFLMALARSIERETRNRCVSKAYDLANTLVNMNRD